MQNYGNGLETKRYIYKVAKTLIFEQGYRHTSISDICKEAHVNRNTLYYHFSSKEQIRDDMLREISEKAHYVVNYYCPVKEYEELLSNAVLWYYLLQRPELARFFREAICGNEVERDLLNRPNPWRVAAFYVNSQEEPPVTSATFWGEGSLQILEKYWIQNLPQHPEAFSFLEIIEQEVRVTGALYQIPPHLVDNCWSGLKQYLDIIPFEKLHIEF